MKHWYAFWTSIDHHEEFWPIIICYEPVLSIQVPMIDGFSMISYYPLLNTIIPWLATVLLYYPLLQPIIIINHNVDAWQRRCLQEALRISYHEPFEGPVGLTGPSATMPTEISHCWRFPSHCWGKPLVPGDSAQIFQDILVHVNHPHATCNILCFDWAPTYSDHFYV